MRKYKIQVGIKFFAFFIIATLVISVAVMALWNAILPSVIGVREITFLQALGLLVLSRMLFGGFGHRGGWRGRSSSWGKNMQEKWGNMTPEDRERFKAEWRERCGHKRPATRGDESGTQAGS